MSYFIGGVPIEEISLTYSWGISPASAVIQTVGVSSLSADDNCLLTLGGYNFYGVCSQPVTTIQDGTKQQINIVDNRLWLSRDTIRASFNTPDLIEDNINTPGIDRQRRYAHILPADWAAQNITYTDAPLTAHQILDYCFDSDDVNFSWSREYHSLQEKLVHEIDASTGKKLGNIVQEISEAQGLVITLVGQATLRWVRKGEGSAPTVPSGATNINNGSALTQNDTRITIVGDRNRYQVVVDLEADWENPWEPFWQESFWLDEVNRVFGPYDSSQSGQAALAAKAREVTVRQYVEMTGDAEFADYRRWGERICRMEIPAWLYIRDIVYKAYRVPTDYSINDTNYVSLQMEELIAAVNGDADGNITLKDPRELYPEGKAYVIVQGAQVELLDPRTQGLITMDQINNMREVWSPNNRFTVDEKNKIIIFESATFLPSADPNGLFVFPNQVVSGIDNDNPLFNICLPNAAVEVSAANVRACLCFSAERYASTETGTGNRRGSHYVSGIAKHVIDIDDSPQEVSYLNGKTANELAQLYLDALTGQQDVYACGGYTRHGTVGTPLTPTIDRVTVKLNWAEALTERVEFTKERLPAVFQGERDLERKQRTIDLFPNQRELKQEARQLRIISRLASKRTVIAPYQSADDIVHKVVGASDANVSTFASDSTWKGGTPVFFDETGALSAMDGTKFGGVTVADSSTGPAVPMASTGIVPVRASSHFSIEPSSDYTLSKLASRLAGCGGTDDSDNADPTVDIAMEIKPGQMLYCVPGMDYVTPFDLKSLFDAFVTGALSAISAAIEGAFDISVPSIPDATVNEGNETVTPANVTFPSLSLSFPSLSFGTIDPCAPLSTGSQAAKDAISAYDFSDAFSTVQSAIDALDTDFDASIGLGSIDPSSLESQLESAISSLICGLANVVDDVTSNLDKVIKVLDAVIEDYLTRRPVGVAQGKVPTSVTDVVLIPVSLNQGQQMPFPKEVTDTLFAILQDIPLFGLAPAKSIADLFSTVVSLIFTAVNSLISDSSSKLNSLAQGLAAGIAQSLAQVKESSTQTVGLIQQEHQQLKSMLSDYFDSNKSVLDSAEQYMLKTPVSVANLFVKFLQAPYMATPKIYLLADPWSGLSAIEDATDFCDLATKLETFASALVAGATSVGSGSYIDDKRLFLLGDADNVDMNTDDLNGHGPATFREHIFFDETGAAVKFLTLSTDEYDPDDGTKFKDAVVAVLQSLTWTVTCNGDGTFDIVLDTGA